MVVRMRLSRFGGHNNPFYRIVVMDARKRRDGQYIEKLGTYSPLSPDGETKKISFNFDRAKYWLSVGAQPSDTVARLLGIAGILPAYPHRQGVKSTKPKEEEKKS